MELEEKALSLVLASARLRGIFLNDFIVLERLIDDYISGYFCSDRQKKKDLMELLICENTPFDKKRFAFSYIVDKTDKELFPNTMKNDLLEIMQTRNIFAHYFLDTSINGINLYENGIISYARFNHKENADISFSQEDYNRIYGLLIKYKNLLIDMQNNTPSL